MDCSVPGFPVLDYLPEFAQTHVHCVGDAIQPSHPLSSPSPSAINIFHLPGLFQWVSSSVQVAKVLELQHQSLQWIFRLISLGLIGMISLLPKGLSKFFYSTTIWKHKFPGFSAFFVVQTSLLHITTGKTIALTIRNFGKVMSLFFNTLSVFVIAFLPKCKHLLISW